MTSQHPGRVLPQDVAPQDGWGEMMTALPISQAEIDDLLYGDDRPPAERAERLGELAEYLRSREPGDFGDMRIICERNNIKKSNFISLGEKTSPAGGPAGEV